MVQDRAILTIADWKELRYDQSHGAIFNYLGSFLTQVSKSRHYWTVNISEMIRDRHMATITNTW